MKSEDAGRVLADVLREYMQDMGIQNGISELGFSREDIPALVEGALPQVSKGSPLQYTFCPLKQNPYMRTHTHTQHTCIHSVFHTYTATYPCGHNSPIIMHKSSTYIHHIVQYNYYNDNGLCSTLQIQGYALLRSYSL